MSGATARLGAVSQALAPAREQLGEYWRWWTGELAGMLPASLRARLTAPPPTLLAEPDGAGGFRFTRLERGIGRPASAAEAARLPVWLSLPAASVLEKQLDWPAMSAADLRRAVRLDLDRQTPLPAEALWFEVRAVRRDAARKRLVARLLVAEDRVVAAALADLARTHGITRVAGVLAAGEALRPAAAASQPAAPARPGLRGWLLLLCAALGVLNLGLHLDAEAARMARLDQAVAEARQRVQRVDALRTQIAERRRLRDDVASRRAGLPLVALLDELTRRIPDEAWLDSIEVRGSALTLSGHAPAAVRLVAAIEASPLLTEAQFRSPVTRDRSSGRERFDMQVKLRGAAALADRAPPAPPGRARP